MEVWCGGDVAGVVCSVLFCSVVVEMVDLIMTTVIHTDDTTM